MSAIRECYISSDIVSMEKFIVELRVVLMYSLLESKGELCLQNIKFIINSFVYITFTSPPVHAYKSIVQPVIFQCVSIIVTVTIIFKQYSTSIYLITMSAAIATIQSTRQLATKV